MGHDLYRMLRAGMPAEWTAGERLVALVIADACYDRSHSGRISLAQLCEETGYSPSGVSKILQKLSRRGYEMRIEKVTGKDGRPVFAARGHATDFCVPILRPREKAGPLSALSTLEGRTTVCPIDPGRSDAGLLYGGERPDAGPERADGGPPPTPRTPQEPNYPTNHRVAAVTPDVEDLAPAHGGAPHQPIEYEAYESWIAKREAANA